MRRGETGRYLTISTAGGERVRAFLPAPLPPAPPLSIDSSVRERLDRALVALGRLDSVTSLLPDTSLFIYTYIRKEAGLSWQNEGTPAALSDLLPLDADPRTGAPHDDPHEAACYLAPLQHGPTLDRA